MQFLQYHMNHQEQNIQRLREAMESVAGRRMQTPKDFNYLSEMIFDKMRQHISPTTLKRLWGYLSESPEPRTSTLNLLAQFIGYDSWEAFCEEKTGVETPSPLPEHPQDQRNKRKRITAISIPLFLAILVIIFLIIKPFSRQTSSSQQKPYVLKIGQHFDTPDDYLKLFGIIASDSLWGKAVPHHDRMFIWTPEYRNHHWHNDGDSALMMPTITEHWEPEEYQADPELIATRNKDQYWHYLRINELRVTFMKNLVDSGYVFLGIYRMAKAQSDTTRCVWERIADECDPTNLDDIEQLRN